MLNPARYVLNRSIAHYAGNIPMPEMGDPQIEAATPYALRNEAALVVRNPSESALGNFAVNITVTGHMAQSLPKPHYMSYHQILDGQTVYKFEGSAKEISLLNLIRIAYNLRQVARASPAKS